MADTEHACVFCGNAATKLAEVSTITNYRGLYREERIPYCNLGCVKSILLGAEDCGNRAVEQAIKIVEALKESDLESETVEEYRRQLLEAAAKHATMI